MDENQPIDQSTSKQVAALQQRHLIMGWFGLLLFLSLGIVLEMLHGFKAGFYLDVQNSSRRLMWTLAHVHGTLFALIHIAFACSAGLMRLASLGLLSLISKCLTGALALMPLGFFSGGLWMYGGDPGVGIFLVPIGALLMFSGVAMFCVTVWSARKNERKQTTINPQTSGGKPGGNQSGKPGGKQSKKSSRKGRKK
ncbi:MAG: hypothetical protein ACR2NM_00225 [Bythopirellula sp.]